MTKASQTRRILATYRRASAEQLAAGLTWYDDAGRFACELAREHRVSVSAAIGVIAALSPQTSWPQNKVLARDLLASGTCGTFGANVVKAARIATGEPATDVLGGLKVRAFYASIAGETDAPCIDRWAARVATGQRVDKVPDKLYRECAEAYRRAARILGVTPREAQAVTWVVVRAEAGIVD